MKNNSARVRIPLIVSLAFCLSAANLLAATTTKGLFFGGDPEDGLDLEGNFLYAVSVGSPEQALPVGGVVFTAEGVPGVTVGATSRANGWGAVEFGESASDNNLESVVNSIGHMYPLPLGPMEINATGLEPGADYKLQLLFSEACCQRAFDVLINGELVVDEFAPVTEQGGLPQSFVGVVITHEFTAEGSTLTAVLDGTTVTTVDYTDLNPILSGFTLERTSEVTDSDGDGLLDDWEFLHFDTLDQDGSDDSDEDAFDNAAEFAAGTNPTVPDSDGDGLPDGEEAATHGTDPASRDTDGEGWWDGEELTTGTDPVNPDTDGDGANDFDELRLLTDPLDEESTPRRTEISLFTGGEAGEGLDLQGNFIYAFDAGPDIGGLGQIGDAYFLQFLDGLTVTTGSEAATWHDPSFGDSLEDDLLELLMASIRWSTLGATPSRVTLEFGNLEEGAAYKLQLLFAEHGWPRGFDVLVDGAVVIDDFSPAHYQGGYPKTNGVVVTHSFVARGPVMTVELDGAGVALARYTDRNAAIQGATLELVASNEDSDGDGLSDPWELDTFGDLTQGAGDDPDEDTLTNQQEFDLNLDPARGDSDRDGLTDGAEVNTHGTNPLLSDSDNDGLTDTDELNTYETDPMNRDSDSDYLDDRTEILLTSTDPKSADTDGDEVGDYEELRLLSDPNDANSRPANTRIGLFTGGDAGEGLDLEGTFTYAVDLGTEFALGFIGEANFTEPAVAGFTLGAGVSAPAWHTPEYGDSMFDDMLEIAMSSISYSVIGQTPDDVTLTFDNLEVGGAYQLQLLFAEACCPRGFDVSIDGVQVADEFSPMVHQGGFDPAVGVVLTHKFTASATSMSVVLAGETVTTPTITDHNAIIQAVTLEHLGDAPAEVTITGLERTAAGISITLESTPGATYQLEYRQSLSSGEWIVVGTAVTATGSTTLLEDGEASHHQSAAGFWRVRQE